MLVAISFISSRNQKVPYHVAIQSLEELFEHKTLAVKLDQLEMTYEDVLENLRVTDFPRPFNMVFDFIEEKHFIHFAIRREITMMQVRRGVRNGKIYALDMPTANFLVRLGFQDVAIYQQPPLCSLFARVHVLAQTADREFRAQNQRLHDGDFDPPVMVDSD